MNKHLDGGNEMNSEKMRMDGFLPGKSGQARLTNFWVGVASVMLVCASAQVVAQVASPRGANPTPNQLIAYCEAEWNRATNNGYMDVTGERFLSDARNASSEDLRSGFWLTTLRRPGELKDEQAFTDCLSRGVLAGRNGTFRTPSMIVKARIDGDTRGRQDPTSSGGMTVGGAEGGNTPEAQRLNTQFREAETRAQNNQAKVDRARKGKPKRHVEGSVAHQCLTPQPGGGVVNACPYAVEYSYCVLRPTKGSWSEAFDCEKSKGGSWQVGPGPNSRSIMHTGGLTTYFFACKYGETLHKPDGISPADIEFQIGRGLLGRCAEWGAGK